MRTPTIALTLMFLLPAAVTAQATADTTPYVNREPVSLSGPRFGVTFMSAALSDTLESRYGAHSPVTQFGWQFETRIFRVDDGLSGVTEFVILVGGLEQSIAIPTATWLVGLRTAGGLEFGVGPSASPAGVGLALAAGINYRRNGVNFPLNVAMVSGKDGQRYSILGGFTLRR